MCGGTLGEILGLNTEQANKIATRNNLNINTDQFRGGSFETLNKAVTDFGPGIVREYGKFLSDAFGDYGSSGGNADTTDTTDTTSTTDNTPAPGLEMTPEERRNNLRRLMASRYGRAQTVLTGGTGISDFGI